MNLSGAVTRPNKLVAAAVSLIVVIFLPITLFGVLLPINEYRSMGIDGALDCDGPLEVMIFIGPALVVYAAAVVYYIVLLKAQRRSVWARVLLVVCVVMLLAAGGKGWAVYAEKLRPEFRQGCGYRW